MHQRWLPAQKKTHQKENMLILSYIDLDHDFESGDQRENRLHTGSEARLNTCCAGWLHLKVFLDNDLG
jgi:hypothetical protein